METIVVGTNSPAKIACLKKVLRRIKVKVKLIPVGAESNISEQPITSAETKRGSLNRARGALKTAPQADMAMGIEIGYQKNRTGKYEILCWVSIVDQKLVISQMSRSFPLPEFHQKVLRAGKYLSDHVRDYYKDASHPVKKYLGTMVQTRESFIEVAIEHALLKYFMEKLKI